MARAVSFLRDLGAAGILGLLAAIGLSVSAAGADAGGPVIAAGNVDVPAGGSATVQVTGHAEAPGIGAYTIDVSYDPAIVHASACEGKAGGLCNAAFAPGAVRITGFSLTGLTGDITFAEITFEDVAGVVGGHGALQVEVPTLSDANVEDVAGSAQVHDGAATVVASVEPPHLAAGDVDCDGDFDSIDALAVLSYVAGLSTPACLSAGDVNCDGDTDSKDALGILRFTAGFSDASQGDCPAIGSV